jgi:FKBP-type peptidyl-prolyl cis-trans isomerase FkpA
VRVMRSIVAAVVLAALPALLSGCTKIPTSPTDGPTFTQSDLRLGEGDAVVAAGTVVTAQYTGWLYDASKTDLKGIQFDTSRGNTALSFTVGAGQVIEGFDQGVVGMKVGGLRRLIVPPTMGYGPARLGPIPPNSTLLFEVELQGIQ